jgi:hypothetical protein
VSRCWLNNTIFVFGGVTHNLFISKTRLLDLFSWRVWRTNGGIGFPWHISIFRSFFLSSLFFDSFQNPIHRNPNSTPGFFSFILPTKQQSLTASAALILPLMPHSLLACCCRSSISGNNAVRGFKWGTPPPLPQLLRVE